MRSTGKTVIKVEIEVTSARRSQLEGNKVSWALKVSRNWGWEGREQMLAGKS